MRKRLFAIFICLALILTVELLCEQYIAAHPYPFAVFPYLMSYSGAHKTTWKTNADGYLLPADFAYDNVSFRGGYRTTTGQPAIYTHTIWILGSSVLVDEELPDADTIPSQLQALMPTVRVVNAGMRGATAWQMEARLNILPVKAGDTVLLLGGMAESVYLFEAAQADRGTRPTDGLCQLLLRHPIGITALLCYRAYFDTPGLWDDRIYDYAEAIHNPYDASIERMRKKAAANGYAFFHVLTPYCECAGFEDYPGVHRAFIAFYRLARLDTQAIDLSRIVDERDFLSMTYVNAHGANQVAQSLYKLFIDSGQ